MSKHKIKDSRSHVWFALLKRLDCATDQELAKKLVVSKSLLSVFKKGFLQDNYEQNHRLFLELLKLLASKFSTLGDMKAWCDHHELQLTAQHWEFIRTKLPAISFFTHAGYYSSQYAIKRPTLEIKIVNGFLARKDENGEPIKGIIVSGMGGIGKSALVSYVARNYSSDITSSYPDGFVWLDIEDGSTVERALASYKAVVTGSSSTTNSQLRDILKNRFILVVINGANSFKTIADVFDVFDANRAFFIATTQIASQENFLLHPKTPIQIMEIPCFSIEETEQLFAHRLERELANDELNHIQALFKLTEGLPLALQILASLIKSGESGATLVEDLKKRQISALTTEVTLATVSKFNSVEACFDLCYEHLVDTSPSAAKCFRALGLLAGTRFPTNIWCQILDTSEIDFVSSMARVLQHFSLVYPDALSFYRLHPLIHAYALLKLRSDPEELVKSTKRYVEVYMTVAESTIKNTFDLEQFTLNLPNILSATEYLILSSSADRDVMRFVAALSDLLVVRGHLTAIEELVQCTEFLGAPISSDSSALLKTIKAQLALQQNNFDEAISWSEQSCAHNNLRADVEIQCLFTSAAIYIEYAPQKVELVLPKLKQLVSESNDLSLKIKLLKTQAMFMANSGFFKEAQSFEDEAQHISQNMSIGNLGFAETLEQGLRLIATGQATQAIEILEKLDTSNIGAQRKLLLDARFFEAHMVLGAFDNAQQRIESFAKELEQTKELDPILVAQFTCSLWEMRANFYKVQDDAVNSERCLKEMAVWEAKVRALQ